jgi:hypothetical protein
MVVIQVAKRLVRLCHTMKRILLLHGSVIIPLGHLFQK